MNLWTFIILTTSFVKQCYGFQIPISFSALGDNAVILFGLAAVGTASLIGACALCFRRKKTFEKLENEAGSPENVKKNEYPIFRALATEVSDSSAAIVPGERNNLSRDNLLNSSDNLATDDNGSSRRCEGIVDSSEIVLLEKQASTTSLQRERMQQQSSRDTITYETEKKHQSPSSKTPLLYAKNVQSYQEPQQINEQMQQKAAVFLSHEVTLNSFYHVERDNSDEANNTTKVEMIDELTIKNLSAESEVRGTSSSSSYTNPFFANTSEDCTIKEVVKDDVSEIESSINDNSEKYQILEEETETDVDDTKRSESNEDLPIAMLHRQNSKGSNCSSNDKSVEEALRALDIAIGFDDEEEVEGEDEEEKGQNQNIEIIVDSQKTAAINLSEIKEEATFLVESIVNDCEKIVEEKISEIDSNERNEEFEDFLSIKANNMSTPCNVKLQTQTIAHNVDVSKALFPGGVDLTDDLMINDTFPISPSNETFNVTQTVNDKTFDAHPKVDVPAIKIEKDKDEISSEDLTTVTPVNTPIELSYSSEAWDKISYSNTGAISKQANGAEAQSNNKTFDAEDAGGSFTNDGWYLHPQTKNETFEIYCEEDDGNMEDMTSTFDQLRRQLTEMLPHAQGMSTHNDFLDDDLNKDSNSPNDSNNYGIKYGELDEASNAGSFDILGAVLNPEPVTELNINYNANYKRPLSPIMEESECDETCRTFVMNNDTTKHLDSTSTGVMESASADAIAGQMPKTLMASNDTLFNFEDTLSDPADLLLSPRMHTAGSSTSSTLSRQESHDRISNERTPTNEEMPKIQDSHTSSKSQQQQQQEHFDAIDILKNNIRQHPLNLDLNPQEEVVNTKYELAKIALEEGSWPLELPEAQQIINDLSSPEQNRTGDSLSFEQDITYTIDDQKTCVSLILKNDEERISEISEPNFASESLADDEDDKANSLLIDDAVSLEIDDNFNFEINDDDENGNLSVETSKEKDIFINETQATLYENDSINPICEKASNFDVDSLEPEAKILNDEMEADSIPASHRSKSIYSKDSINETSDSVQNSDNSTASVSETVRAEQDSSEDSEEGNDRKKGSSQDIRQVSCNQSVMSTSFTKEWSDDDSSHSSEEFMYVKGQVEKILTPCDEEDGGSSNDENSKKHESEGNKNADEIEEVEVTWSNLQVQETPVCEEESNGEDESGEEESWKPSCWDQSLQPVKSSLKSPEKENSPEQQKETVKTRRRVAFKVQRYHSVYEYPSEVVQLSPAYSEPQLWANYLEDGAIDYFTYSNQLPDLSSNALDGFNVSSSSRPFHSGSGSSSSQQLHNTWPTESSDFSWSQFQDSNELNEALKASEIPFKIEWPIRKNSAQEEDDSGVCESSESQHSIGELKSSLRLPLELVSSSTSSEVSDFLSTDIVTKDLDAVKFEISNDESLKQPNNDLKLSNNDDDESDKMIMIINDSILPTPLSGSMDSLSSHSASSNSSSSPSFTTFGKENKIIKESELGKTSIIFIEDGMMQNAEAIDSRKLVVGSSDDDSGFENVQIKCEAK